MNGRGFGWGYYRTRQNKQGTVGGGGTTLNNMNRIFDNAFAQGWAPGGAGTAVPWQGFWYGYYGQAADSSHGIFYRLGMCNTWASDCGANLVFHPDGETTSTFTETASNQGTEIRYGEPGLVFILWAR